MIQTLELKFDTSANEVDELKEANKRADMVEGQVKEVRT